jgi:hypothetical protein
MSTSYSPKTVTDGLVLCLDAGNTKSYVSGSSTWYDLSGNGNHGTLYNSPSFIASSRSLSFNGSNQYMQANINSTVLDGDPSFTMEMFVLVPSNFSTTGFWGVGGSGQGKSIEGWAPTTNRIHFDMYDSTRIDSGVDYVLNRFYHIVWTKNGTGVETSNVFNYINGVKSTCSKTRAVTTGPILNTSTSGVGVAIGRINGDANAYYAACYMGVFKIYNRALSESEVLLNYNSLKGRFGL